MVNRELRFWLWLPSCGPKVLGETRAWQQRAEEQPSTSMSGGAIDRDSALGAAEPHAKIWRGKRLPDPQLVAEMLTTPAPEGPMGVVEHRETLCCLGLKSESAMIAFALLLHGIIPHGWSRISLCEPDATIGNTYGENPQWTMRSDPHSNLLAVSVLFVLTG